MLWKYASSSAEIDKFAYLAYSKKRDIFKNCSSTWGSSLVFYTVWLKIYRELIITVWSKRMVFSEGFLRHPKYLYRLTILYQVTCTVLRAKTEGRFSSITGSIIPNKIVFLRWALLLNALATTGGALNYALWISISVHMTAWTLQSQSDEQDHTQANTGVFQKSV